MVVQLNRKPSYFFERRLCQYDNLTSGAGTHIELGAPYAGTRQHLGAKKEAKDLGMGSVLLDKLHF
jgi:hypothetical protein